MIRIQNTQSLTSKASLQIKPVHTCLLEHLSCVLSWKFWRNCSQSMIKIKDLNLLTMEISILMQHPSVCPLHHVIMLVFNYFREIFESVKDVCLYKVMMKLFRENRDFGNAEKLFDEMLQGMVKHNVITFSRKV